MHLKKNHLIVEFATVDPKHLSKPIEPPLLIRPTDEEFVKNLAIYMMKNPIAAVAPWLLSLVQSVRFLEIALFLYNNVQINLLHF